MGIGTTMGLLIKKSGITVSELSRRTEVPASTIYSIIKRDNKKVDIDVLLKIADELGISADQFFIDTDSTLLETQKILTTSHEHVTLGESAEEISNTGIGKHIKEARESLGLTRNQLGERVGVTGSSITNYEKGTSHPKEPIMYKLLEVLGVDANYLFQDVVNISNKINDVTISEYEYIKKYRKSDESGKQLIKYTIDYAYSKSKTDRLNTATLEEMDALNDFIQNDLAPKAKAGDNTG